MKSVVMNQDDFENTFPELSTIQEIIEELRSLDLSHVKYDDLKNKIKKDFVNIPSYPITIPGGQSLFRARTICQNSSLFTRKSDIGINKKEYVTKYGRANKPNEPLFYCATNLELALNEVGRSLYHDPQKYHVCYAVVGEWVIDEKTELQVSDLCYSPRALNVREDLKRAKRNSERILNVVPNGKAGLSENTKEVTELTLEFFSDEFSKENIFSSNDYKISVAYMDILMERGETVLDGIKYPSVASRYNGDNIVLSEKSYNSKLDLLNAYVLAVGFRVDDPHLNHSIMRKSLRICGDEIVWG